MNFTRDGIPLAMFLTFMNVWGTWQFGVPIWCAWGCDPSKRVGILLLAGVASASLAHAWAQIISLRRLPSNVKAPHTIRSMEDAGV